MSSEQSETKDLLFSSAMREAKNYMRWVMSPFASFVGKSVLEMGFGHSGYRTLLPADIHYVGVDIDAKIVEEAKARHGEGHYIHGDASDPVLAAKLADHHIDTILCFNVLEIIEDDVTTVANLLALMVPGGHLCLFVPAFEALYSSIDKHAHHVRRYQLEGLKKLVDPAHGLIVKAHYFNALGGVGWWLNKWSSYDSLEAPAVNRQLALFDRYLVPLARLMDVFAARWFGQSIVMVVRKI